MMLNKKEPCKICGHETEWFQDPKGIAYHYCQFCQFISKDAQSLISNEDEFKIYNNHNNSIEDDHFVAYFKNFIDDAIMGYCGAGRSGFDFGSGPSPVLALILQRDYGFSMDCYDLFYLPFKIYEGKQYDLVTSTEVVEHLEHPMETFRLLKSLLKPEGVLAIMTLFHANDQTVFLNSNYRRDKSHIGFFTPRTMAVIADLLGLEILACDNYRHTTFKLR